jgi:predicted HAD superfamily Cof-like phosphohydrolase
MELAEAWDVKATFNHLAATKSFPVFADPLGARDGDNVNQVEALDALCDLEYVVNWSVVSGGYHPIFDHNFNLVHRNNMAKAHTSREAAEETLKHRLDGKGFIEEPVPGLFVVYNEHTKVAKPHNHQKVTLTLEPNEAQPTLF